MDYGHPTIKSSFLGILILGLAFAIPWYDRPQIRVESEPVDLLTMAQMLRRITWRTLQENSDLELSETPRLP